MLHVDAELKPTKKPGIWGAHTLEHADIKPLVGLLVLTLVISLQETPFVCKVLASPWFFQ